MPDLLAERKGGVVLVTLNRPEALNALNSFMIRELGRVLDKAQTDDTIHGVVLTGAGERAFCAGGDIKIAREGGLAWKAGTGELASMLEFLDEEYALNRRLFHFIARVEPGKLLREGLAKGQGFGALRHHDVALGGPHKGQVAALFLASVGIKAGHAPARFLEVIAHHAHAGGGGRLIGQPNVAPLTISAAPVGAKLARIVPAAFGNEPEAVDGNLHPHDFAVLRAIPAFDGVNLAGQGIEPGALALVHEQLEFIIGAAFADGTFDEVNLLRRVLRGSVDWREVLGSFGQGVHRFLMSWWFG